MDKPRVAITCRALSKDGDSKEVQGSFTSYIEAVLAHGGVPILIPAILDELSVRMALQGCHGLLLPGGEDVMPSLYDEAAHPKLGSTDLLRDTTEIAAIRCMHSQNLPILGICRGAQILNVAFGGTLYQDLADQFPTNAPHRESGWEELSHQLDLVPGTRLQGLLGCASIGANSLHHQAVKVVADTLRVCAVADDGVIEGVESPSHSFCVGVQCHPEAIWRSAEPRWSRLFTDFVTKCADSSRLTS